VCTGALGLAAAGVLQGLEATTHWLALDVLKQFGAIPMKERVVRQGKVFTAAGEHILIVHVLRARRAPGCSLLTPSASERRGRGAAEGAGKRGRTLPLS